ncbi:MAG: PVC-type heme-binding CxxCH protein [Chthoniobacteraceae bacterium]
MRPHFLLVLAAIRLSAATPPPESQPLSPLDAMKKLQIRAGYGVELVAAEPLTIDPVAIDWDTAGRLWVVEMADYPLGMDGNGKAGGRVRVLDDTDGDGRYDKSTLFADGLNFPNGVLAWRDGVIITAAPDILFLRDTDGDGRADQREVLVTGLLEGNQQLRANGLRWGLDNWVYCAAGGHHGNYGADTRLRSNRAGIDVAVGSRDFRFRPDTGALEPESGPSQFGRNRDDWGHWFGTQNSRPLWHYVLADRYLRRNPHVPAPDPTRQVVVPLNPKVWPASPPEKRFHSFNQSGHFTSACAGMIYRDELLFPRGERHAFTCEPFHNLVQHNVVTDDATSFAAHRAPGEETSEFFSSEDRWCRPVMTRTGPDGALWVVDMYRYMIEHPQFLTDAGKAELLPHYRLGDDKGRIYRLFPVGAKLRTPPRLADMDTATLVHALDSPNEWQRDKAHQLLLWRADKAARDPLATLARESANPLARLHALCVLDGLDALAPELVVHALADPHPGVRENALRLAENRGTPEVIAASVKLVDDADAKVRLRLACTLGEWKDASAGEALARLALKDRADSFTLAAVMSSAVPHARALSNAGIDALSDPLIRLALGLDDRDSLATLLAPIVTSVDSRFTVAQMEGFGRFLEMTNGTDRAGFGTAILAFARTLLGDEAQPTAQRAAAAGLLARDPTKRADLLKVLPRWLAPSQPGDLQRAAVRALGATGDSSVPATLLEGWPAFTPGTRAVAIDVLLAREPWAFALLDSGNAPALDGTQRGRLQKHSSPRVRTLAGKIFKAAGTRAAVVAKFQPALKLAGDGARGREVFTKLCVACHKLGDAGNEVGPNLASVVEHPPEKLLLNILDPNADVQPGFYAYFCQLADSTELYGLMASETGTSITFKLADGTQRPVLRKDIKSLRSANASLMPEGLEAAMTPQDLADLIGFLRTGGKGKKSGMRELAPAKAAR